eukprot:jgi/Botrbrau1/517/Bobra.110_2s0146.1
MAFKVKVTKWQAVATWTWGAGDDVCGICRSPFDGCAPDQKYPGDDSSVSWGVCSHPFHLQCIQKWTRGQTEATCPICRQAWEFKSATSSTAPTNQMQQQGSPDR